MTTRRKKPAVLSSWFRKTQVAVTAPSAIQPPSHNVARYRKPRLSCEETVARTDRLPLAQLHTSRLHRLLKAADAFDFSGCPVLMPAITQAAGGTDKPCIGPGRGELLPAFSQVRHRSINRLWCKQRCEENYRRTVYSVTRIRAAPGPQRGAGPAGFPDPREAILQHEETGAWTSRTHR
jgi:hypothetical protein